MEITPADKALAAKIAAAHPLEPVSAGRDWHVKVYKPDGSLIGFTAKFESGFAAAQAATEEHGFGCSVIVRPAVEETYIEGLARYPDPLHPKATDRAREGWAAEAARMERAVLQQMRQPGYGNLTGAF